MTEKKTQTKTKKFRIIPNTERVICKFVDISSQLRQKDILLVAGQLKAGENLLCAQIVEPGTTHFKPGQIIYYSEYSASQLVDVMNIVRKDPESPFNEMKKEEYRFIVIAEDDIMAYEEEVDPDLKINEEKTLSFDTPAYKQDVPIIHR